MHLMGSFEFSAIFCFLFNFFSQRMQGGCNSHFFSHFLDFFLHFFLEFSKMRIFALFIAFFAHISIFFQHIFLLFLSQYFYVHF